MPNNHILRLHWKLYIPLVGLLWLIIGITISYFVSHEKKRLNYNLETRLANVNNTVIDAYNMGIDIQKTTDFISMFVDKTTLSPVRITIYDDNGSIIADNIEPTISIYSQKGGMLPEFKKLWGVSEDTIISTVLYGREKYMVSSKTSPDGRIHTFAALPYKGEVKDFLSTDPMVWIVVIILGLLSSVLAYIGVRAVCKNLYTLRDFANNISSDKLPENIDEWQFSKDELGDVSRNLVTLYRDKINAENEKTLHERRIGMNISHELNTPVGIIMGYLDSVLENKDMPDELKYTFLERARQNTGRLASLINDISMVMRLQGSSQSVESAPVNIHDIANQLALDIPHGTLTSKILFVNDIPEGCTVMAQETLLSNAIMNLIRNAAQHSGGDRVTLSLLEEKDGYYYFGFVDNGCGVGEEHLDRLFDIFYRVDKGRSRKNGGSGLGLSIVQKIIQSFGGSIKVENASEGGLKFIISLKKAT